MINDTMKMQTADPGLIRCRDCLYRDRDTMELGGKTVYTGVMRDTCMMFNSAGNWKPTDVLLYGADCPLYEKDVEA